ncbi:hypothetical protein BD777DRAFT_122070 [Yarrowia lipolytica]|nr:hypothetical protein BD777DRAFT_122070 [Yarrowia lipolytica]
MGFHACVGRDPVATLGRSSAGSSTSVAASGISSAQSSMSSSSAQLNPSAEGCLCRWARWMPSLTSSSSGRSLMDPLRSSCFCCSGSGVATASTGSSFLGDAILRQTPCAGEPNSGDWVGLGDAELSRLRGASLKWPEEEILREPSVDAAVAVVLLATFLEGWGSEGAVSDFCCLSQFASD